MDDEQLGHLWKIPIESVKQRVEAKPQVHCSQPEIVQMLQDLKVENFVGKIKDLSKGATKRKEQIISFHKNREKTV